MTETKEKSLDFICIGAAKSATTTLYDLMKDHPDITMPTNKEAPFFSDDKAFHKGFDWYLKSNFPGANKSNKWGTITPQYMIGQSDVDIDATVARMYDQLPQVKIIAIVRHPIKRAFSHYKMLRQRGYESRSFEEAAMDIINGKKTLEGYDERDSDYIGCSEYGRILKKYYDVFPEKNIIVITTDDLSKNTNKTLKDIFSFIGVDDSYVPRDTSKVSRKGGNAPKFKYLTPGFLFRIPLVKKIWQNYTPHALRRRVEYTINLWNTKPDDTELDVTTNEYRTLIKHFSSDIRSLENLTKKKVPWKEWQ